MTLALKWMRRIAVAVIGFTVLSIGVCMIVLPGPAFIVIPAGLGILALEFAWARRWLDTVKEHGSGFFQHVRNKMRRR
jgi:tellurite resistance protein TerC